VSSVQYNWIKTAGLQLVEGRDFNPSFATDSLACLINQTTVEKLGLREPVIGQMLGGKAIIGVFHNFVFNNPSGIIAPMAVYLSTSGLGHFFVRIQNDGQWRQTLAQIKQAAKKVNPNYPFDFYFTKEGYQIRFQEFASEAYSAALFGGMAIFISCLGVFGLSTFLAEKRSKEMSIRKVFGASVRTVWFSLSKDFLKPVFIALLLVIPNETYTEEINSKADRRVPIQTIP
jgi:ABC-type antimicrobial peptide transport system permease subunit